MKIVKN